MQSQINRAHQRQRLRQMTKDTADLEVIQQGMQEPADWETALTAMLMAVRCQLPNWVRFGTTLSHFQTTQPGLNQEDRAILQLINQAALAVGAGRSIPDQPTHPPEKRAQIEAHVLRCVAGVDDDWRDRVYWWTFALTTPLSPIPPPTLFTSGIVKDTNGRYRLRKTGIELCWVGAGHYLLGDEILRQPPVNPLRFVDMTHGFFIAKRPITTDFAQPDKAKGYTRAAAQALCETLSAIEQLEIDIPTPSQWEMAARGTDGRRFPWGNSGEDQLSTPAPSGATLMVGDLAQWTSSIKSEEIGRGGAYNLTCSWQTEADSPHALWAVRPVVHLPTLSSHW